MASPVPPTRGHSRWEREKVHRDLGDTGVRAEVGADQVAYYHARSPWYDDVYACRGDYDGGSERNGEWLPAVAAIEAALARAPMHGDCVELGAGSGYWSERVVDRVDRLWLLDAVPEMLDAARGRLGPRVAKVDLQVVDLWRWEPDRVWDCALACFFLEHVPDELLPGLLTALHAALRPDATVFMAEGATFGPEPQVETREIGGRAFQVVERRRSPAELTAAFASAGFSVEIGTVANWVHLTGRRS